MKKLIPIIIFLFLLAPKVSYGLVTLDSYTEGNQNNATDMDTHGDATDVYQAFTTLNDGTNYTLDSSKFYLRDIGGCSPISVTAKIYAITGTYGSSATPTGSALATSDTQASLSVSSGSYTLYTFSFSGAQRISLTANTHYATDIHIISDSGGTCGTVNGVQVGSANPGGHGGNKGLSSDNGSNWSAQSAQDAIFYVYGVAPSAISNFLFRFFRAF